MNATGEFCRIVAKEILAGPGGGEWSEFLSNDENAQVFVAGGYLRNRLLKGSGAVNDKDIDLFISGNKVDALLARLKEKGHLDYGPFGSPRWRAHLDPTVSYDVIPIQRFRNGLWDCEDIVDVLNQFDFTANAIAVNLRTSVFFDPQNGVRDLVLKVMRCVRFDYPEEKISSSCSLTRLEVLWFRMLHYARLLQLRIEPITEEWIYRHRRFAEKRCEFEKAFFMLHSSWDSLLKDEILLNESVRK